MSVRQLIITASILAAAIYLRLCLPVFSETIMPVFRTALSEDTVAVPLPEAWIAWAGWD